MNHIRVVYDTEYNQTDYRILELNNTVVDAIQVGNSVYIKGEDTGQCVLSTSAKSYSIEKIDTSNTVLLCNQTDENSIIVKGVVGSYLELLNNPVDIRNIISHIPDFSTRGNSKPIHIDELFNQCLYSESEIQTVINTSPYIIEDNDHALYQVSSKTFHSDLIQLVQFCILHSISLQHLSIDLVLESNPPFENFYTVHLLHCISNETNTAVDKRKLVYYLARGAFLCNDTPIEWISREDLQNKISLWLPSEMDFDIMEDHTCLEGVTIHETVGKIPGYHFVDRDVLELNPSDRLRQLFMIESEWTQEDLIPFIADLESFGFGKPGDLLLKYCREVTFNVGNEVHKHYVLRH